MADTYHKTYYELNKKKLRQYQRDYYYKKKDTTENPDKAKKIANIIITRADPGTFFVVHFE